MKKKTKNKKSSKKLKSILFQVFSKATEYLEGEIENKNFDKKLKKTIESSTQFMNQFIVPGVQYFISNFSAIEEEHKKNNISIEIKKLTNFQSKEIPSYETDGASGLDVRAQLTEDVEIAPHDRVLIPTGFSVEIPKGYEFQARPRSGRAFREGLGLPNSPGTIDSDYRGEVKILLCNYSSSPIVIKNQDRIAQLVLCPVMKVNWLESHQLKKTKRGEKGFGSTGKK